MMSDGAESIVEDLKTASRTVDGWLSDGAIGLFALIGKIQTENKIRGDIFEIGCHHGKSAIVLALLADRATEQVSVCDIFERQDQNISRSGRGNKGIFLSNMQSVFAECNFLRVLEKRSQDLLPAETGYGYRLFHIDGGHTVEEVKSDLELASKCIGANGVIVCDDALHPGWPTVAEAIFSFLFDHKGEFSPVVVGFNKLVIVRNKARKLYETYLEAPDYYWKYISRNDTRGVRQLTLCGQNTTCFIPRYWEGVQPE